MTDDLVARARRYATEAHARIDQRRKYTGQPYEAHLKAVAKQVQDAGGDHAMVAAAWLHDTVEDTPATLGDIEREFGADVAALVADLTDVSRPSDGNRAQRRAIDRAHSAQACARAQTVKLADLIDNCRDISRHDPQFARTFMEEMEQLLTVLEAADPRLRQQAYRTLERCRAQLDRVAVAAPAEALPALSDDDVQRRLRQVQVFAHAFAAQDIADTLASFDAEHPAARAATSMQANGWQIAGVRRAGRIDGCVSLDALQTRPESSCGELSRPLERSSLLAADASLAEVVHVLTRQDHAFVTTLGEPVALISRAHMQKPVVRMWLFGIITFAEMDFTDRIRRRWPGGEWTAQLSSARLEKARLLQQERQRRGHVCTLLDCLQFGDKARVLASDAQECERLGLPGRSAAKRVIADLESLRNHLAHAQDIVSHDWAQIARLAQRVEEMVANVSVHL
ncbi:HD domain-containing protein [Plasticicumulans acidivorans]|uniref:HD domain-containing protein n=1 Tax=Plasticicumulans acidivorans TaxID=886464 RepID=A0A317MZP5_9GAMM|nr:HD domain-containing protein [Plasticicumulans acidivorans]PWV65772.1 HD domain-containing protein [Plasticicumulans acidivorans]